MPVLLVIEIARATIATPLGDMLAFATTEGVCGLEFTEPHRLDRLEARLLKWLAPFEIADDPSRPAITQAREWLNDYFEGACADSRLVKLDLRGTPFERSVWDRLLDILPGATRTYGEIARELGRPSGARAVGLAVGSNPVGIIVPCHRVVGSTGALTGYGGGLPRKQWLLGHETHWWARTPARLF